MNEILKAPALRKLSPEEAKDFLVDVGVDPSCPSCGHPTASVHVRENGSVSVMAMPSVGFDASTGKGAINLNRPSLVIASECDNCGMYRTFSYVRILNWLNARDAKS